jgi:glycosyltransferase involved in cell wall biosynthesis
VTAVGKDRIFAFATNKPLAVRLTHAMGLPVMTAPLPHFYETAAAADALPYLPAGDGPLVACLGMQRQDKRFTEWPAIIEQAHRRRSDLRFLVQVGAGEISSSFAALESNPRIRLVRGYLDDRTFAGLIEASDLLLLPYKPERYVERISGPFVFGAVYGTPSVVPARSWMAERIAEGRGVGVTYDGDDAALVEALAHAADDLPNLKAQAAGIMKDWRTWDARALISIALHWCAGRSLEDFKRGAAAT